MHSRDLMHRLLQNYEEIMSLQDQLAFPGSEETETLKDLLSSIIGSISRSPELMKREFLSSKSVSFSLGLQFFDLRDILNCLIQMFNANIRVCEGILILSEDSIALCNSALVSKTLKDRISRVHASYKAIKSSCVKCMGILDDVFEQMFVTNREVLIEYEEEQEFEDFLENYERELYGGNEGSLQYEEARSFPNAWCTN